MSSTTPDTSSTVPPNSLSFGHFFTQLKVKLMTPQFYWFLGHLSTLFHASIYSILTIFSSNVSKRFYSRALLSIIFTYFIVLYQIMKSSKLNFFNPRNLFNNDNFHYLVLAIVWYLVSSFKIISVGLLPFIIFSTFHSLKYFQNYVLPILPNIPAETKNQLSARIDDIIARYNEQSLYSASYFEVMTLGQLSISSPLIIFYLFKNFRLALVNIFVLFHFTCFMKFKYRQSKQTKTVFDGFLYKADTFAQSGSVPQPLVQNYYLIKGKITNALKAIPF